MGKYNATVSPADAARRLGMSVDSLRECMKQDKFPFPIGVAIQKKGNANYTYYIYEAKLEALEQFWGLTD